VDKMEMELAVRTDAVTEMEGGRGEACDVGEEAQRGSTRGQTDPARQGTWATGGDEAVSAAKPTMSYIALIATAILSSPEQRLNLASIYKDVQDRFPYFRTRGQGWKNSVRHNLSLNDCFVKLGRCEDGKGSYWGIHPAHHANFLRGDFRQHRKAGRGRLQRALRVATTRTVAQAFTHTILIKPLFLDPFKDHSLNGCPDLEAPYYFPFCIPGVSRQFPHGMCPGLNWPAGPGGRRGTRKSGPDSPIRKGGSPVSGLSKSSLAVPSKRRHLHRLHCYA
uniref:Forkhead box protein G1 n=1 Tax=Paramormyrops kingsleyae TaxID=1676925 RepID=A0A3B3R660_9TELE